MMVAIASCSLNNFKASDVELSRLVYSILSDPKTFNYALNSERPNIFGLTYKGLISENYETGEIEPELAESWQFSDNGLALTYTLREDLKWSDGEPLTADDVVFTYNDIFLNDTIPTQIRDILRVGEEGTLPTITKLYQRQV